MLFLMDFEGKWYVLQSASHHSAPDEARDRWPEHFDDGCFCFVIPKDQAHKIPTKLIGNQITPELADEVLKATGQKGNDAEVYIDVPAWSP